ncbi:hypothetical protein ACU8V3_17530 [Cobetia marina]
MADLRYLKGYGPEIQQQASELLASGKTAAFFSLDIPSLISCRGPVRCMTTPWR